MSISSSETIALDSHGVDAAIEALSSAAVNFRLKPRQRFVYRLLMASVDLGAAALVFMWLLLLQRKCSALWWPETTLDAHELRQRVEVVVSLLLLGSGASGLIASLLGVRIIKTVFRERERLKALGLDALATSVWRARRSRSVWSGLREAVLACLGAVYALGAALNIIKWLLQRDGISLLIVPFALFLAALFLGARVLRVQKEKIELASRAIALRTALLPLRDRARSHGTVTVPTEFVRQAAMIESAHTAEDRQAAILRDAGREAPGYAIAYQPEAIEQRARLEVDQRIELEDLLVRLGVVGGALEGLEVVESAPTKTYEIRAERQRVGVTFTIDDETRTISITSVRSGSAEASGAARGSNA